MEHEAGSDSESAVSGGTGDTGKEENHLYAVMYNWQQEPDIQVNNLAAQLSEYSGIIFVGDSRTYFMQKTLLQEYGKDAVAKVSFVCKTGED